MKTTANYCNLSRTSSGENALELCGTDGWNTSAWGIIASKTSGKARDLYAINNLVVIVTTDRQSAFDRNICFVPLKGQVLTLLSKWWFELSKNVVPNAFIACPHPNVTIAKKCAIFPVEFVVRGYITGSTATSMWTHYANGVRNYCGHLLPDNLRKNTKLFKNIITPTTKSTKHDELISPEEIVHRGLMTQHEWDTCEGYAHSMFTEGQKKCAEVGLLLVDTKYEFGVDQYGTIRLVDEVHTPDSSRFWIAESFKTKFENGQEPAGLDKEVLRLWYMNHSECDPYDTSFPLPDAPQELVQELSCRYIAVYERITEQKFDTTQAHHHTVNVKEDILNSVTDCLASLSR